MKRILALAPLALAGCGLFGSGGSKPPVPPFPVDTIHKHITVYDTSRVLVTLHDTSRVAVTVYDSTHVPVAVYDTVHSRVTIYDTTHVTVVLPDTSHQAVIVYDTTRKEVIIVDTLPIVHVTLPPDTLPREHVVLPPDTLPRVHVVLPPDTTKLPTVFLPPDTVKAPPVYIPPDTVTSCVDSTVFVDDGMPNTPQNLSAFMCQRYIGRVIYSPMAAGQDSTPWIAIPKGYRMTTGRWKSSYDAMHSLAPSAPRTPELPRKASMEAMDAMISASRASDTMTRTVVDLVGKTLVPRVDSLGRPVCSKIVHFDSAGMKWEKSTYFPCPR